jgi:hypothetical protein
MKILRVRMRVVVILLSSLSPSEVKMVMKKYIEKSFHEIDHGKRGWITEEYFTREDRLSRRETN